MSAAGRRRRRAALILLQALWEGCSGRVAVLRRSGLCLARTPQSPSAPLRNQSLWTCCHLEPPRDSSKLTTQNPWHTGICRRALPLKTPGSAPSEQDSAATRRYARRCATTISSEASSNNSSDPPMWDCKSRCSGTTTRQRCPPRMPRSQPPRLGAEDAAAATESPSRPSGRVPPASPTRAHRRPGPHPRGRRTPACSSRHSSSALSCPPGAAAGVGSWFAYQSATALVASARRRA